MNTKSNAISAEIAAESSARSESNVQNTDGTRRLPTSRGRDLLNHYTLQTGHNRLSPRHEVADCVIDFLEPLCAAGGGQAGPYRFVLVPAKNHGGCVFTIYQGELPIVSCGLCTDGRAVAEVWSALSNMARTLNQPVASDLPPPIPWLADLVLTNRLLAMAAVFETADMARCIAWTVIERVWKQNTRTATAISRSH